MIRPTFHFAMLNCHTIGYYNPTSWLLNWSALWCWHVALMVN